MKKSFRVVPLPTEIAETARATAAGGRPDHKIVVAPSATTAPCRHCLRWAEPGESMILFPYQSIAAGQPYAESGPIFVHQEACERYANVETLPAAFRRGRVVRAYNAQNEIVAGEVPDADPEPVIDAMLAQAQIAFLHLRSLTHGCYTMKIERA